MRRAVLVLAAAMLVPAVVASCTEVLVDLHPTPDAGADVTPDAGPDVSPPDAGPDVSIPDAGIFTCDPDAGVQIPPPWGCPTIDPQGYGACGAALGYGFDGTQCVAVGGCPPGPSAGLFASSEACSLSCAAGQCDPSKLGGMFPPGMTPQAGDYCDDVEIRVDAYDDALLALLCAIDPDLRCEDTGTAWMRCYAAQGTLSAAQAAGLCTMSLMPQVQHLVCWIYL